jgi:hypothetical protein
VASIEGETGDEDDAGDHSRGPQHPGGQ